MDGGEKEVGKKERQAKQSSNVSTKKVKDARSTNKLQVQQPGTRAIRSNHRLMSCQTKMTAWVLVAAMQVHCKPCPTAERRGCAAEVLNVVLETGGPGRATVACGSESRTCVPSPVMLVRNSRAADHDWKETHSCGLRNDGKVVSPVHPWPYASLACSLSLAPFPPVSAGLPAPVSTWRDR